jgi:hypothetical protein
MTGLELIARERRRQIVEKGWSAEHDAEHVNGELALAGAAYAVSATRVRVAYQRRENPTIISFVDLWPWDDRWDKRSPRPESIRSLTKAGALIAAEIDRLLLIRADRMMAQTWELVKILDEEERSHEETSSSGVTGDQI